MRQVLGAPYGTAPILEQSRAIAVPEWSINWGRFAWHVRCLSLAEDPVKEEFMGRSHRRGSSDGPREIAVFFNDRTLGKSSAERLADEARENPRGGS